MHERPLWASENAKDLFAPVAARPRVGVAHILNSKDSLPAPSREAFDVDNPKIRWETTQKREFPQPKKVYHGGQGKLRTAPDPFKLKKDHFMNMMESHLTGSFSTRGRRLVASHDRKIWPAVQPFADRAAMKFGKTQRL